MINAKTLREVQQREFNERFDFASFDEFINKRFGDGKTLSVNIGLEPDNYFKTHYKTDGLVAFGYAKCGYWETGCQIAYRALPYLEKYLKDNGFNIGLKGLAGFDTYDILIVKL